jgi:hypothetical protein
MTTELDAKKQAFLAAEAKRRGIAEWQLEMMNSVSDDTIRAIVADAYKSSSMSSIGAKTREQARLDREEDRGPVNRSGWVEPQSLKPPDGLRWIDQQLDQADAIDKASLREKAGEDRSGRMSR